MVNACSRSYCVCRTHQKSLCPLVAAKNGVLSACLCSLVVVSSSPSPVAFLQVAGRKRDRQASHFGRYKALHPEQHVHKHSNTNPTTVSNSCLPISAIAVNPSPSTSIRSSCGRFIRIALPTVVARVWPTTSSSRFVPPSTVEAVR